jgi:hypothetical protein
MVNHLNHLNSCVNPPSVGDVLVIETKRNKGEKVLVVVKDVVKSGDGVEVIIQKGRNKYFNFDMYREGTGWVWRVWNLGQIKLTSGLNNQNLIDNM